MQLDRIIAVVEGDEDGPSVICSAGTHGNEWVTIYTASIVAARLAQMNICGRVLFVRGNLPAIAKRRRYIDVDFNRIWTEERIAKLERGESLDSEVSEFRELEALYPILENFISQAKGEKFAIDLHSASSSSQPFSIVTDAGPSYRFAVSVDVPCVLWTDDEELGEGGLITYAARKGCAAVAFEAGPCGHPRVTHLLESCLWHALINAGVIEASQLHNFSQYSDILADYRDGVPQALEIVYQHLIQPSDKFAMEPGYTNFQVVEEGQLLGRDAQGPVVAELDSHVLFPLYQEMGDYGFLLTRGKRSS